MGNTTFYGSGSDFTVDTSKVFTVVTQFIESGGSLSAIKRFFVQDGKVIPLSNSDISGVTGNEITQDFCDAQKKAFGDQNVFDDKGGMSQIGKALSGDMVLVMSLWDDHYSDMLWLDSTYPTNATASTPGAARGSCSTSSGAPSDVESNNADASVTYSNIKFGPINSTFTAS
jgi:cellulose 1,4-beta-cellobiosidase